MAHTSPETLAGLALWIGGFVLIYVVLGLIFAAHSSSNDSDSNHD